MILSLTQQIRDRGESDWSREGEDGQEEPYYIYIYLSLYTSIISPHKNVSIYSQGHVNYPYSIEDDWFNMLFSTHIVPW